MRDKPPVRVGAAAADFGEVLVGHAEIAAVREIIEHRRRRGVLLGIRQLFDLAERVAKQLGHASNMSRPFRPDKEGRRAAPFQNYFPIPLDFGLNP